MPFAYILVNIHLSAGLTQLCSYSGLSIFPQRAGWGQTVDVRCSRGGQSWWCYLVTTILGLMLIALPVSSEGSDLNTPCAVLTLVDRTVTQDQGAWIVDYRLRHTGKTGVIITPDEIEVKVEGWVSNSRVATHAVPRWSSLIISHGHDLSAVCEVIAATDEAHRCRDRLVAFVWAEEHGPSASSIDTQTTAKRGVSQASAVLPAELASSLPISAGPGAIIRVRLRFEHQHILYGDYDPLLAVRAITMLLGSAPIRDIIPMDREQYLAQPRFTWHEPPEERRDTRHAVTGPDSLHLEAQVPGHQYYRYPERPVRYNTKMRLRFWYLIAAGTEGECRARVAQFKDTPTSWRILNSGGFEQCLKTVGRWTKVDRFIQTEPEATTLTLEFKIVGETEVGEMWIDDVSLEPVDYTTPSGP